MVRYKIFPSGGPPNPTEVEAEDVWIEGKGESGCFNFWVKGATEEESVTVLMIPVSKVSRVERI